MKSTWPSRRARSVGVNLLPGIQRPNREDVINLPLMELEPLGRREREHPANQGQIDPVLAVISKAVIRQNFLVRAHTNIVPPPPEVLHLLVGSIQTSRLQEGQTRPNQSWLHSLPDHP